MWFIVGYWQGYFLISFVVFYLCFFFMRCVFDFAFGIGKLCFYFWKLEKKLFVLNDM